VSAGISGQIGMVMRLCISNLRPWTAKHVQSELSVHNQASRDVSCRSGIVSITKCCKQRGSDNKQKRIEKNTHIGLESKAQSRRGLV
jgi:hypothetical protein